jgi:hypothetical protein
MARYHRRAAADRNAARRCLARCFGLDRVWSGWRYPCRQRSAHRWRQLAEAAWALAPRTELRQRSKLRGGALPGRGLACRWTHSLSGLRPRSGLPMTTTPNCSRSRASSGPRCASALGNDLDVTIGTSAADIAAHYAVYAESGPQSRYPGISPHVSFPSVLRCIWHGGGLAYSPASGGGRGECVEPVLARNGLSLLGWRDRRGALAARQ